MLTVGELFAGYGGLGMGVAAALGGEVRWVSDIDKGACKILAHRFPDVPNLGDITAIDWEAVEPVDVLTGGYPCQPFSHTGRRAGVNDDRHLWPHVATAIGLMRPEYVLFENVRGHLTLGFDEVLRDLSLLHYDVAWVTMRAADIGAAHGRARIFILGRNSGRQLCSRTDRWGGVHRDSRGWRINAGSPQGRYDRQGVAGAPRPGGNVRREVGAGQEGHADAPGDSRLATERQEGSGTSRSLDSHALGEVGGGSNRPRLSVDGRLGRASAEWSISMDRGDAHQIEDLPRTDSGGESTRPRPLEASWSNSLRCPTARFLVRAGGRPFRPSGVRGEVARQRLDDRGAAVRATSLLPTPSCSDTNGAGQHGDGGLDLRTAVALLGTPTARDGKGSGQGERLLESARRGQVEAQVVLLAQEGQALGDDDLRGVLPIVHGDQVGEVLDGCGAESGHEPTLAQDFQADLTLLPTPACNDMGEGKTPEAWDTWTDAMKSKHGNGNGHGKSLAIEAQRLFQTPSVADATGGHETRGGARSGELLLNGQVKSLATEWVDDTPPGYVPPHTLVGDDMEWEPCPECGCIWDDHDADGFCMGDCGGNKCNGRQFLREVSQRLLPTPRADEPGRTSEGYGLSLNEAVGVTENGRNQAWGDYAAAIARWEDVLGRPAPAPTQLSAKGNPQLSARFTEWMMGLPAGWITDVPGITRNEALKACGNGVVPQQGAAAIRWLWQYVPASVRADLLAVAA